MGANDALIRAVIARVGDKWTLRVIASLREHGETRFTRLKEHVEGISQRLLTKTLRDLEQLGLVARRTHAIVPPRVDYTLTPLGESLATAVTQVCRWVDEHAAELTGRRDPGA